MTSLIELPARKGFVTPEELRTLLKQNLGLNQRQVTVRTGCSTTYLTVTVRDPKVDLKTVRDFCAKFDTWTVDNTDYCEGQSVDMTTTREVDDAHAAPFLDEIKAAIAKLLSIDKSTSAYASVPLSTGANLVYDDGEVYVRRDIQNRGSRIRHYEVENDWAVRALALQAARI